MNEAAGFEFVKWHRVLGEQMAVMRDKATGKEQRFSKEQMKGRKYARMLRDNDVTLERQLIQEWPR